MPPQTERENVAVCEPWSIERASRVISTFAGREGALMPMLHAVQQTFGYVPRQAVPLIAEALNLSRAEVHGTISFYHDFRREPPGRHVLKLCRAEACQALGADQLHAQLQDQLRVGWHETTADGSVTLEPVFCLGLCAVGPSALLDDTPLARLDAEIIVDALRDAA